MELTFLWERQTTHKQIKMSGSDKCQKLKIKYGQKSAKWDGKRGF